MTTFLFLLLAVMFFLVGVVLFLREGFKEPTIGKAYLPRFYEKTGETNKLVVFRKLTDRAQFALAWFFFSAGIVMFDLLLL